MLFVLPKVRPFTSVMTRYWKTGLWPFTDNICGPLVKHLKMRQFLRNSKPYDSVLENILS